jgi:hypothetical protein
MYEIQMQQEAIEKPLYKSTQQKQRTTRQQCSNSRGTRGSETVVEQEAEGERKEDKEV